MSAHTYRKGEISPVLPHNVCVLVEAFTDLCVDDRHMRCNEDLSHLMDAVADDYCKNEECCERSQAGIVSGVAMDVEVDRRAKDIDGVEAVSY